MALKAIPSGPDPKHEQLICALMTARTKEEAAEAAGIARRTMFRWLADPEFQASYRAARRQLFDDALCVMEKGAMKAAQALVDALDLDLERKPFFVIMAATRLIDRAFKAQTAIAVEEELAALRALMEELKAMPLPLPAPASPSLEAIRMAEDEQAEAARLRVAWMTKVGHDGDAIESSLKLNRPQSLEEERYLLDLVEKMLQFEEAHSPERLLAFAAGEIDAEGQPIQSCT